MTPAGLLKGDAFLPKRPSILGQIVRPEGQSRSLDRPYIAILFREWALRQVQSLHHNIFVEEGLILESSKGNLRLFRLNRDDFAVREAIKAYYLLKLKHLGISV